MKIFDYV